MTISTNKDFFQFVFWIIVGFLLAYGFLQTQKISLGILQHDEKNKILLKLAGFSFARIVLGVAVIFLGFMQSMWFGLACLVSFIVFRWVFLFISIRKNNH